LKVEPGQLLSFHAAYGTLLKNSMPGALRKRDKKREKIRSEQAAQRKKRIQADVVVSGPKRGKGRRKRQRQIKAAIKQQESREKFKKREEQKNAKAKSIPS
jgi:signal recognition particle subunit SRP14